MSDFDVSRLEEFARQKGLILSQDPFHGSQGLEFRRRGPKHTRCVGFLTGKDVVEVYERTLDNRDLFLHERLWFLEPILRLFLKTKPAEMQKIGEIERSSVSYHGIAEVLRERLLNDT